MRTLLASLFALLAIPLFAGVPYLDNPTNNPGIAGQTLFSTGLQGYYKWDWGTNAASSNATVVVSSPSIGVTTNGPGSYTPFLTSAVTNSLLSTATNESLLIGAQGTNQSWLIGANATNSDNFTSNKLWLQITNGYVIAGANVTVTTNTSGQTISYTIASTGGGGTTNVFIAAGANVTVTTNVVGSSTIYTIAASSGAGIAAAAGVDMLLTTNAGVVTFNFNTIATNLVSITGTNSATLQFGGSPPGNMLSVSNGSVASGGTFMLLTNGSPASINRQGSVAWTNGYMSVINAKDYGLSDASGDNTAVIQAAIAACPAGGTVFIPMDPSGAWNVTGTLHLTNHIRLIGETANFNSGSGGGTVLYHSSSDGALISIEGLGNCEIGWIGFQQAANSHGYGITTTNQSGGQGAVNFSIHDCTFQNFNKGIWLQRSWDIMDVNNYFNNCLVGRDYSNAVNGVTIIGGHVGGGINSIGALFEGGNSYGIFMRGVVFEALSNSISATGVNNQLDILGNYFESNTNNIVLNGGGKINVKDNVFIQGSGSTTTNVIVVGAASLTMEDNQFFDSPPAWNIDATSTSVILSGNRFDNATAKTQSAIAASTWYQMDGTNVVLTGVGGYFGTGSGLTNVVVARSNIVDQIQTWPTSTNQLVAVPGSTSWLLQSATPTAQTNISGTLSATQWIFQSLLVSNSTAAAFTNWITIPAAKAVGYSATNDVASLGIPGTIIPASSYKEILFKVRLGQTNWAVINP